MTVKQLNKLHPEKYVMTDGLFYIGELNSRFQHTITEDKSKAASWSYADTLSNHKLDMAITETKLSKLEFQLAV